MNELLESDYLQTIDELKQQNKEMYETLFAVQDWLSGLVALASDKNTSELELLKAHIASILAKVDGKEGE